MDKLMKQALEQNKIIRYIPTFIKVMETYKKLLEEHNEALRQCNVSGLSEQSVICEKCRSTEMYQYTKTKDKCGKCGNIQYY